LIAPGLFCATDFSKSADAETNVTDDFPAEGSFQFPQDFGFGDLFELVVQGRLKHANVENSVARALAQNAR
jgi:hypothetical protein